MHWDDHPPSLQAGLQDQPDSRPGESLASTWRWGVLSILAAASTTDRGDGRRPDLDLTGAGLTLWRPILGSDNPLPVRLVTSLRSFLAFRIGDFAGWQKCHVSCRSVMLRVVNHQVADSVTVSSSTSSGISSKEA